LLQPGDVVAVDALTYPGFKVLAEQFHLELVAVPACGEAMDLEALRKLCKSVG
jgi:DNA-binding transcriptional MocR family regulator